MHAASKLSMLTAQMEQDSESDEDVLANLGLAIGSDGEVDINLSDSGPMASYGGSLAPSSGEEDHSASLRSSRDDDESYQSGAWARERSSPKWDTTNHAHERSVDESDELMQSIGDEDDERIARARVASQQPSWARDSAQLRNLGRTRPHDVDVSAATAQDGGYSDEEFEEDNSVASPLQRSAGSPYRRSTPASPSDTGSMTSGLGDEDDVDLCSDDNVGLVRRDGDEGARPGVGRSPFAALALKRRVARSVSSGGSAGGGGGGGGSSSEGGRPPLSRRVDSVDGEYSDGDASSAASTPLTDRSRAAGVSVILFTVTFHANPAHNLTCSPHSILILKGVRRRHRL